MKYRSTIFLLLTVVTAALVAWFAASKPTSDEVTRRNQRLMPDLQPEDVQRITIRRGDETFVCEKQTQAPYTPWMITKPHRMRADASTIDALLEDFTQAHNQTKPVQRDANSREIRDSYGLGESAPRITFETSGGKLSLTIGKQTGLGDMVYVRRRDSDAIQTAPLELAHLLRLKLFDLQAKHLIAPARLSDVESFSIRFPSASDQQDVLCRPMAHHWRMESPVTDRASARAIARMVKWLSNHTLEPEDYLALAQQPDDFLSRFNAPDAVLRLQHNNTAQKLSVIKVARGDSTDYVARYGDESYAMKIPRQLYDRIMAAGEESAQPFRAPTLSPFPVNEAKEIDIQGREGELTIIRDGDQWTIQGEKAVEADDTAVRTLLHGISHTPVGFTDNIGPSDPDQVVNSDENESRITVSNSAGHQLANVSLKMIQSSDHVYAQRWNYPPVFLLPRDEWVSGLTHGRATYRDREIMALDPDHAIRLDVTYDDRHTVCERRHSKDDWRMLQPVGGPADESTVESLLNAVSPLRAKGYARSPTDKRQKYGLDAPWMELRITCNDRAGDKQRSGKDQIHVLSIGLRREDYPSGYYAMLNHERPIFILSEYFVNRLQSDLASRTIAEVDNLRSVTITTGGETYYFEHDSSEERWQTDGETEPDDELHDALSKLRDLLQDFQADRVSDYVISDPAEYGFNDPTMTIEFSDEFTGGKKIIVGDALSDEQRYVRSSVTGFATVVSSEAGRIIRELKTALSAGQD